MRLPGLCERSNKGGVNLKAWLFFALVLHAQTSMADVSKVPFHFRVNMVRTDLVSSTLEPKAGTVTDLTDENDKSKLAKLTAQAKPLSAAIDRIQLEIFVENLQDKPIDAVSLKLTDLDDASPIYDLTQDAYNTKKLAEPGVLQIGRLAPYGIKRILLGVKKSLAPEVQGELSFGPGAGEGQTTTNILVTPDDKELWAVSTDTGEVVAYGLPAKNEIVRIPVGAKPASIALQQKQDWIVVSAAGANTLTIIDRKSKSILNVLGKNSEFGPELQQLLVSQKSPVLYVTSYVEGTLSRIVLDSTAAVQSVSTLKIGARPSGMSMTYDESHLYIAHFLPRGTITSNESWVSIVNLAAFRMENDGILEDHFNPANPRMQCLADFYNSYPPAKLIYGKLSAEDFSLEGAASQLSGVFLDPSGQTAWIPGTRITGALVVLERGKDADPSLKRFGGLLPGQLSAPIIFPMMANTKSKLEPIYTRDVEMAIPTLRGVVTCMHHPLEIEFIDRTMLGNGKEQINPFLAYGIPHAGLTGLGLVNTIRFSKGGRRVFMLSHISDELTVYDGVTMHPLAQRHLQLSGSNPKGMALSADFKRAYVLYENSGFISELDMSAYSPSQASELPKPYEIPYRYSINQKSIIQLGGVLGFPLIRKIDKVPEQPLLKELGHIQLMPQDPLSPEMRRGKILFSSANPDKYSVSMNRLGACASCHPDGGSDGSSWVTMEGPRRTISLRGGVEGRGWLHISATHSNIREFVESIVPERLGGELNTSDLDAMAAYVGKGIPKLQSPRVDQAKAARGQKLFASYCQGCHAGPEYTSGLKADGTPKTFNLGTASANHHVGAGRFANVLLGLSDGASKKISEALQGDRQLGAGDEVQSILDFRQRPVRKVGELKAPSLVNTFDYALYFHDGSVDNLKAAIKRISDLLRFGLSESDVDDLEQYIKTL